MMPAGTVQSLKIAGDTVKVEMSGLSLAECSAVVAKVQAEPIVAGVAFGTAETDSSAQDVLAAFTLTLGGPEGEE